ncbi:hypothetical protein DCAR_0102234 [Daucus carota subsp. sativus]|uniref:Uncharacterized protein n=1 Tax=Daucus carota subsp. sativus TaxID=79200 RepID=A0A162AIB8_DAUCS|nr:hypothetical protein DCAR_0102234 [Daucus carota subsp. sativus]
MQCLFNRGVLGKDNKTNPVYESHGKEIHTVSNIRIFYTAIPSQLIAFTNSV